MKNLKIMINHVFLSGLTAPQGSVSSIHFFVSFFGESLFLLALVALAFGPSPSHQKTTVSEEMSGSKSHKRSTGLKLLNTHHFTSFCHIT